MDDGSGDGAFRRIYESREESFVALAAAAGLDPAVDFRFADLREVDFGSDDLANFDFTGSDLSRANLAHARIENAIFADVHDDGTIWPDLAAQHAKRGESSDPLEGAADGPRSGPDVPAGMRDPGSAGRFRVDMDDGDATAGDVGLRASADFFGQSVRASAGLSIARYHYFCADEDARLPDELVIVANTRAAPIRDNALLQVGNVSGALEAALVPGRGGEATQLRPVSGRGSTAELRKWKASVLEDFAQIERSAPHANYVCMSEFSFPFGLSYKAAIELPPKADVEWRWLQSSEFLSDRFVCLGSAHRSSYRTARSKELKYENVAVIYPSGTRSSLDPKRIFTSKRDHVMANARVTGVELMTTAGSEGGIIATFKEHRVSATRRGQLSQPGVVQLPQEEVRFAKNAFDFYNSIASDHCPPVYLRKRHAAHALGEYLDSAGKPELDIFVTQNGVIAVLIGQDAQDPTTLLSAVRLYYESMESGGGFIHPAVDIFFIPAFNRSFQFIEMCKAISRETSSVVVYVSSDPRCVVRSEIFVCGQSCADLAGAMTEGERQEDIYSREHIPGHEHLHVYRISRALVSFGMRALRTHMSPQARVDQILMPRRLGAQPLD